MKKILLVFDGTHFSMSAFDFISRINETHPVLLTGLFLPSIDYTNTMTYYLGIEGPAYAPLLDSEMEIIEENIRKFKALCEKKHIEYRVHDAWAGSILESIQKETRYSDLLILSSELFYSNLGSYTQRQYIHDTSHNAECPVLLLPEQFSNPQSVILAYDGSESSVFAIKQFAYLFPELATVKTALVYASEKHKLPDADYIKEYAARHFQDLHILKLEVDPKEHFLTWLHHSAPAMLVCGAYGRSLTSEAFKKSFIYEIAKEHSMPIFIAHK